MTKQGLNNKQQTTNNKQQTPNNEQKNINEQHNEKKATTLLVASSPLSIERETVYTMVLSAAAKARLKRELVLVQKGKLPGIEAKPKDTNDNNTNADLQDNSKTTTTTTTTTTPVTKQWTHWTATIEGPRDSPFAGIPFTVSLQFPPRYPMAPPECQFVGPLIPYHPNIDASQGRICLDTLKRPPAGSWSPAVSLASLLLSLQVLLGEPNADDGLEPDATRLYQQSRHEWHVEAQRRIQKLMANTNSSTETPPTKVEVALEQTQSTTTAAVSNEEKPKRDRPEDATSSNSNEKHAAVTTGEKRLKT